MKEITGDLFDQPWANVICITTNGYVKKNGEAVMGAGCAREAKKRLGNLVASYGNFPYYLGEYGGQRSKACLVRLIERSAVRLKELFEDCESKVVIPRPGCGNGMLDWETEVKPVLEKILDDRFYVITNDRNRGYSRNV